MRQNIEQMCYMRLKNKGFTIAELAIVLVIISFLISMVISTGYSRIEAYRINLTKQRMHFLMKSIVNYANSFDHLPCPAAGSIGFQGAGFGVADQQFNVLPNPPTCNATGVVNGGGGAMVGGIVPTTTMKITSTAALDGWGNRISYVVDQDLTYAEYSISPPDPPTLGYTINGINGTIIIANANGAAVGADVVTDAAVLLISHGPNGFGAWRAKGGSTIPTTGISALENENIDNDARFVDVFRSTNFDDFIIYRSKWQLEREIVEKTEPQN